MDGVEAEVERVKHGLRKQAQEEVTPIPTIYNDALVDISTQVEDEAGGVRKAKRRKVVQREEKIKSLQLLEREPLTLTSQLLDTV